MLKINKKKKKIFFDYCGFAVVKELSDYPLLSANDIALVLVNEIRLQNGIPLSSGVRCQMSKVLSDGTEVYDVE